MMCSLASAIIRHFATESTTDPAAPEHPSPSRQADRAEEAADRRLTGMLLRFFRNRLRAHPETTPQPGLPSLLVRRTLNRLARRRTGVEPPSPDSKPRKAAVMRAALMELRRIEAPTPADDPSSLVHRN